MKTKNCSRPATELEKQILPMPNEVQTEKANSKAFEFLSKVKCQFVTHKK